jgi:hypothetical protein
MRTCSLLLMQDLNRSSAMVRFIQKVTLNQHME